MVDLVVTDFEERILPDEFTVGGAVVGLAYSLIHPVPSTLLQTFFLPQDWDPRWKSFAEALFGCLFASGALWAIGTIYKIVRHREGLGFGDVKMVAMIGAFLGVHATLATLILGSLLGSVVGLAFILLAKKDAASYELPFGSFLGIAAVVILFLAADQR
jgi:leader peptidase (prepilin peptidase)/N-methyltransferase